MQNTRFTPTFIRKNTEDEWKHFLWSCELITTKGRVTVDFKMGLGHVHKSNQWLSRYSDHHQAKPKAPKIEDILHSLIFDQEAMHMSFNDWCDTFGYDQDSIKAFRIYQDCCESGKKLDILYTREQIRDIKEALQDY